MTSVFAATLLAACAGGAYTFGDSSPTTGPAWARVELTVWCGECAISFGTTDRMRHEMAKTYWTAGLRVRQGATVLLDVREEGNRATMEARIAEGGVTRRRAELTPGSEVRSLQLSYTVGTARRMPFGLPSPPRADQAWPTSAASTPSGSPPASTRSR